MNSEKDIRPISYIKANAVLLDTQSFDTMTGALGLLKLLAQGECDIESGDCLPQEEFFRNKDRDIEKGLHE